MNFIRRIRSPWHADSRLLSCYIDGELSDGELGRLAPHLESCAICRIELEGLRGTVDLLRSMPVVSVPRSFVLLRNVAFKPRFLAPALFAMRASAMAMVLVVGFLFISDSLGLLNPESNINGTQLGMAEPASVIRDGNIANLGFVEPTSQAIPHEVISSTSDSLNSRSVVTYVRDFLGLLQVRVGLLAFGAILLGSSIWIPSMRRFR